jgi:hypothetical protein
MKQGALSLLALLFSVNISFAQMMPMMGMFGGMEGEKGEHAGEVHPFLSHMALPDQPGEVSLRLTGFQPRLGGVAENGYGAHLETGLWDRWGLHIRNDDIQKSGTEIMLQFAVLRTENKEEGIALIVENEMPGLTGETTAKFKAGLTALKLFWGQPLHLALHYDPADKMVEYSAAQVIKANERLALIVEYSGASDGAAAAYLLEALKFRLSPFASIGLAFQSPVSAARDFDSKTLIQADWSF